MYGSVIPVIKPVGLTPLEVIHRFKMLNPQVSQKKISYAGRLDPMAEGILLLLVGDENKKRKTHESLKKTYKASIVLGIETDSFDALGMVLGVEKNRQITREKIVERLKAIVGKKTQDYPPYSSKPVNGKPLFWWARNNKLSEIEIPKKEIEIFTCDLLGISQMSGHILFLEVVGKIEKIKGDFRQKEIIEAWKDFEDANGSGFFCKIEVLVSCSSGTYIRGIANSLGRELCCGAFALSIERTRVGKFTYGDCMKL